ncbi:MAG: nicotinamide-nucleotide adenylyltransferase [Candidatus Odinarchaeota archaeon]|nr:nicotinamide-nucleotide adenylyltransferase [Candidatus Odinarchaeota archaeon]
MTFCRAFYIGRFQPFHKGHLHAIKYILNECDEVVIGIGSAQLSYSIRNPFTAGERMYMIRIGLLSENIPITRFWIVPIPDVNNNDIWVSHVKALSPTFNVVYSNNSLVTLLFEKEGYEVRKIPFLERDKYSATYIRKLMLENKPWEHLVPKVIVDYIKEIKGPERLQTLASKDE